MKFIRNYFNFNSIEVKGIRFWMIVFFIFSFIYLLIGKLLERKDQIKSNEYILKAQEYTINTVFDTSKVKEDPIFRSESINYLKDKKISFFNPNFISKQDWIEIGLSEKQANVIMNYKSMGGVFKSKDDLKKMYVINDYIYNKIEPYLVFESSRVNEPVSTIKETIPVTHKITIDINNASKEDWMKLNGIGDKLSDRIILFKDKLGGFYSIDQIKEVYGLSEETFNNIKPNLVFNNSTVQKISINHADYSELSSHPYIKGKLAGEIINYRKKNGTIKSKLDLINSKLMSESDVEKLNPYIDYK